MRRVAARWRDSPRATTAWRQRSKWKPNGHRKAPRAISREHCQTVIICAVLIVGRRYVGLVSGVGTGGNVARENCASDLRTSCHLFDGGTGTTLWGTA